MTRPVPYRRWPWIVVVLFWWLLAFATTASAKCAWALHVMTFAPTDPRGLQGAPLYATRAYTTRADCKEKARAFYKITFPPGVVPLAFCVAVPKECDTDIPN